MDEKRQLMDWIAEKNIPQYDFSKTDDINKNIAWISEFPAAFDEAMLTFIQQKNVHFAKTYHFASQWNGDFVQRMLPKHIRCFSAYNANRLNSIETSQQNDGLCAKSILIIIDTRDMIQMDIRQLLDFSLPFSEDYKITYLLITASSNYSITMFQYVIRKCSIVIYNKITSSFMGDILQKYMPEFFTPTDFAHHNACAQFRGYVVLSYHCSNPQMCYLFPEMLYQTTPLFYTTNLTLQRFQFLPFCNTCSNALLQKDTTLLTYDEIVWRYSKGSLPDSDDLQAYNWILTWTFIQTLRCFIQSIDICAIAVDYFS